MESLNQFVNSFAPKLSHWRRDFHHYAESGWVEFRTATLVAEELHQLGYSLALGREVVNESSRMGLPDEFTLQREFERARQQGALEQWIAAFRRFHWHRRYPGYRSPRSGDGFPCRYGRAGSQ